MQEENIYYKTNSLVVILIPKGMCTCRCQRTHETGPISFELLLTNETVDMVGIVDTADIHDHVDNVDTVDNVDNVEIVDITLSIETVEAI